MDNVDNNVQAGTTDIELSTAQVVGENLEQSSTTPAKKRSLKRGSSAEKTIFNSKPLLTRQTKALSSSEIKVVIDQLQTIYETKFHQEVEEQELRKAQENKAQQLLEQAKELGVPLDVLQNAISNA